MVRLHGTIEMTFTPRVWCLVGILPWLASSGCGANDQRGSPSEDQSDRGEENIATVSQAITTTFQDDSASPVHVQIKKCTTDVANAQQTIDCTLDSGFALVGGGAWAAWTGAGALLTMSAPVDTRTWRAASKDHVYSDPHHLSAYAVGLRLDGVNASVLRNTLLKQFSVTTSPAVPNPTLTWEVGGVLMFGGGVKTNTSGPGLLLTQSYGDNIGIPPRWIGAAKDHGPSSPGTITLHQITLSPNRIIEGFGGLETQQRFGGAVTVTGGVATATGTVHTGWALAGYGGLSTVPSGGAGRLLFRMGMETTPRNLVVQSKDHQFTSGGTTTATWTQVRKVAGSHGLCSAGGPLQASMDACVANICQAAAANAYCCNSVWDSGCISHVATICGRTCGNDTCSIPSYTPTYWNTGQIWNNCYNYATNKRTDTFAQPGRASGESCATAGCYNATTVSKYTQNDGLIPTTAAGACPDSRDKLALVIWPSNDYHFYRRDSNGFWTHKPGGTPATNLDSSGVAISNPETANRGNYTVFAGYFCACSSTSEGQGHSVVY